MGFLSLTNRDRMTMSIKRMIFLPQEIGTVWMVLDGLDGPQAPPIRPCDILRGILRLSLHLVVGIYKSWMIE